MVAWWIVLALAVFMSSDKGDAISQDLQTRVVKDIKTKYGVNVMFSVAVNIPLNNNGLPDLARVIREDPPANVKSMINRGDPYEGTWVVAATVKPGTRTNRAEHAEFRVLSRLTQLETRPERNFIVVYTHASPCNDWCTNANQDRNILQKVSTLKNWSNYVFAFGKVFQPRGQNAICETTLRNSLMCLANANSFGLANIFRCDKPAQGTFTCSSCNASGQVADRCVRN